MRGHLIYNGDTSDLKNNKTTPKLLGYRVTKVGLISAALIEYLIKLNQ